MPVSSYFANEGNRQEQWLQEDLVNEMVKNHGIDVLYIPRESRDDVDHLYGEDTIKKYVKHYTLEMYLLNTEGFDGDDDFFAKFGLEIRKELKVAVPTRVFRKYVPASFGLHPREGDLCYIRFMNALFEIKEVEEDAAFFQFAKKDPYYYELTLELFKVSNELVSTGLGEVDTGVIAKDVPSVAFVLSTGNSNDYIVGEQVYQGANLATATSEGYVLAWDKLNLTLTLRNIKGVMSDNATIKGAESNAQYTLVSGDETDDASSAFDDNKLLEQKESSALIFDESNPFGTP